MLKYSLINLLRCATKQQLHAATITTAARLCRSAKEDQQEQVDGHMHFPSYTEEQQLQILKIVNQTGMESLLDFDITKSRVNKLNAWMKRNGPLKNVDDILLVEGFGVKVVEKFYSSMLEERSAESKLRKEKRQRKAPFITPAMAPEQLHAIRSCVSVRIGVSSVSWARLEVPSPADVAHNSPCLLTHWQHHEITEKKLHLNDLAQRLLYIMHQIPMADCYLFENPQMAQVNTNPGSAEQQNISIQKAQINAVLAYALGARNKNGPAEEAVDEEAVPDIEQKDTSASTHAPSNVFYLKRFLWARLFNQLVGTERVSSEETITQLMRVYYNVELQEDDLDLHGDETYQERLSFRGNVQFPQEQREMFARAERFQREFLGQALLLNLAFVRLVLLQDEQSIAAVTRNAGKSATNQDC